MKPNWLPDASWIKWKPPSKWLSSHLSAFISIQHFYSASMLSNHFGPICILGPVEITKYMTLFLCLWIWTINVERHTQERHIWNIFITGWGCMWLHIHSSEWNRQVRLPGTNVFERGFMSLCNISRGLLQRCRRAHSLGKLLCPG